MNKLLNKLRNQMLISSILSVVFLILSSLNIIQITDNKLNMIINHIMSILSILGVLIVPVKKEIKKE